MKACFQIPERSLSFANIGNNFKFSKVLYCFFYEHVCILYHLLCTSTAKTVAITTKLQWRLC